MIQACDRRTHALVSLLVACTLGVVVGCTGGVEGRLTFFDKRDNRSDVTGSLLTSTSTGNRPIPHAPVALFDAVGDPDFGLDDDIPLWVSFSNWDGYYAFPVNTSGRSGVYVAYCYELADSTGGTALDSAIVRNYLGDLQCIAGPGFTGSSSTITKNMSASCPNDANGVCPSNTDVEDILPTAGPAHIIGTASEVQLAFGSLLYDDSRYDEINYYWPNDTPFSGQDCSATSVTYDNETICMKGGDYLYNHTIAHETAHALQMRLIGLTSGYDGGCTHSFFQPTSTGNKCATTEGFADFLPGALYFSPTSDPVHIFNHQLNQNQGRLEQDTTLANTQARPCAGQDSYNSTKQNMEMNSARFFWDLFDDKQTDDESQVNTVRQIADIWALFPPGNGDHQATESGGDGRNAKDYAYRDPDNLQSIIEANCLDAQAGADDS